MFCEMIKQEPLKIMIINDKCSEKSILILFSNTWEHDAFFFSADIDGRGKQLSCLYYKSKVCAAKEQ